MSSFFTFVLLINVNENINHYSCGNYTHLSFATWDGEGYMSS